MTAIKYDPKPGAQLQRPLTRQELLGIGREIRQAESGPDADARAILAIFDALDPEWRDAEAYSPNRVAIPSRQWTVIAGWCGRHFRSSGPGWQDARTQSMLSTWVNVGPSTYEPEVS